MPLYEYRCGDCNAVAEINHRMSDPAPTDCPKCGAAALSKLISAAGFRLKGSGWYETDFKSDGKRNLAGDSQAGDSKSGSAEKADTKGKTDKVDSSSKPSAGKSDAKPATSSAAPAASASKPDSKA